MSTRHLAVRSSAIRSNCPLFQLSAILAAVRPDRQTVLFSATFPKAVENLAKKSLRAPLEIMVGGRSVASDSVDQFAEVSLRQEQSSFYKRLTINQL